jgi:DNA primase
MGNRQIDFRRLKRQAAFEPILTRYGLAQHATRLQRYILCPFHAETKPSCKIDAERKIFRCFGCGAKGSILDFVAKLEDCNISEAATIVASCCGISDGEIEGSAESPELMAATSECIRGSPNTNSSILNPPLNFVLALDSSHPYLVDRGMTPELIERFGVGYCDRGLMRGRIAIPIHNQQGQLIAYAGRWAAKDIPSDRPRYLLPRKFRKQGVLYNLNRVVGERYLVLVESYWSVFRLSSLGVPTVGLMGRELSDAHASLLGAAGVERIGLMLDGDAPGRAATAKMLPDLARHFFVRHLELRDGMKPHSAPEEVIRTLVGRS